MEEEFAIDRLAAQVGIELVEMAAAGGQLIGKDVGQRYYLRRSVLGERGLYRRPPRPAAQQAEPDGGVCLIAKGGAWLEK